MVGKYKSIYHRSINLKPTDASKPAYCNHIHNALFAKVNARKATPPKFHVGDKVRIVRKKGTFEKGFTIAIATVKATKPPTYTIEDTRGEPVQVTFYEQVLQTCVQEIYRIERVLKRGIPSVCQLERLQQCIESVDTTSRR